VIRAAAGYFQRAMAFVTFTPHLFRYFPGLAEGEVPGATVAEVIGALDARHPGFRGYLVDDRGALRQHVNVFVAGSPVKDREELADRVAPTERIFIAQALSGGRT
jgi:sulfur-carrier protein